MGSARGVSGGFKDAESTTGWSTSALVSAGSRSTCRWNQPSLIPLSRLKTVIQTWTGNTWAIGRPYSEIPSDSRAAYLDWLAAGRPAGAYIGYVFLFFYGIERRVLIDLDRSDLGGDEAGELIAEVERLHGLYGDNNSFQWLLRRVPVGCQLPAVGP